MSGLSRVSILSALAALGASMPAVSLRTISLRKEEVRTSTSTASLFDRLGQFSSRGFGYPSGPGFTGAHVKRMAKKHRNQQRNKKACRGSAAFR